MHGLVALLEIQASGIAARTGPDGEPVLLLDQDRARWDRLLINRGLAALEKAKSWAGNAARTRCRPLSPLVTPGRSGRRTLTGPASSRCTTMLAEVMPSPVVELNRAVAISMAYGPQAGLDLVDQLAAEPALRSYHLLPSVRGDLLERLGRTAEARAEFERAAGAGDATNANGGCRPSALKPPALMTSRVRPEPGWRYIARRTLLTWVPQNWRCSGVLQAQTCRSEIGD